MIRVLFAMIVVLAFAQESQACGRVSGVRAGTRAVSKVIAFDRAVITAPFRLLAHPFNGQRSTIRSKTTTVQKGFVNPVKPPIVVIPMQMPPKK